MDLQNSFLNDERIELKERDNECLTFANTDCDSRNSTIALPEATIPLPEGTIALPEAPIQEIHSPPSKETRIYLFDLGRFLASLMVVLFHYEIYYGVTAYGYLGVQFFFILSGFVITISADGKTFGEFLIFRLKRILPCFWICCTLLYIVHLNFKCREVLHRDLDFGGYIKNMFFLARLTNTPYLDGVYWTLYIEMQFYLLVAVLLLFKNWKLLMDIAMCAILVITWYHFLTIKGYWYMGPETGNFLHHGWTLALGHAFAGVVAPKTRTKLNWLALTLGIPLLFYLLWFDALWRIRDWNKPINTNTVMAILVVIVLFFFVAPNFKFKLGKKTEKVVIFLGGISYPLYLFHRSLMNEIHTRYLLTTWQHLVVIPIACIIHEFLEKPFVSLITRCLRTTGIERRTERRTDTRTDTRTGTRTETRTETGIESKFQETGSNINMRIAINSYGSIN